MSRRWLTPALVVAMTAAALVFWSALPERIPTHSDFSGQPDDWMPKWPGAFLFPALGLACGCCCWAFAPSTRGGRTTRSSRARAGRS
ncbi:MAG TPA: DUF1648 domain-containing protein [Gemmatimonadota bacterium]|nr:DUF1648 domain-containing protein [Gemmatimonadota bacterium]